MASPPATLRPHHLAAANLLGVGLRRREVAEILRLHPCTLSHWYESEAFRDAVRVAQERLSAALVREMTHNLADLLKRPRRQRNGGSIGDAQMAAAERAAIRRWLQARR